jgi:hypothetical protein
MIAMGVGVLRRGTRSVVVEYLKLSEESRQSRSYRSNNILLNNISHGTSLVKLSYSTVSPRSTIPISTSKIERKFSDLRECTGMGRESLLSVVLKMHLST